MALRRNDTSEKKSEAGFLIPVSNRAQYISSRLIN